MRLTVRRIFAFLGGIHLPNDFVRENPDIKLRNEDTTQEQAKEKRRQAPPKQKQKQKQKQKKEVVLSTDSHRPVIRQDTELSIPETAAILSPKNDGIRIVSGRSEINAPPLRETPHVMTRSDIENFESSEDEAPEAQAVSQTEQAAVQLYSAAYAVTKKELRRKYIAEARRDYARTEQEKTRTKASKATQPQTDNSNPMPRTRDDCVTPIQTRPESSQTIRMTPETTKNISTATDTPKKPQETPPSQRNARWQRKNARKEHIRSNTQPSPQRHQKAAENTERAAAAIKKSGKAILDALTSSAGIVALLVIFCIVVLAGAIASSPLGILFTAESGENTLQEAIAEISAEYSVELHSHQSGSYTSIRQTGHKPSWLDVVAVFACKTAMSKDGADVLTLDSRRISQLGAVFWDMTEITSSIQRVYHADTNPDDELDDSWTESILTVNTSAKTADDMRREYGFTQQQNEALDLLLAELEKLGLFLSDLGIEDAKALALWDRLPADLSEERRQVIQQALTLVGKVSYFWGGKSLVLGWDDRWGNSMLVSAPGSYTSGTYRPYGLDCSGYVDWVFYNVSGGSYVIGRGGGCGAQHRNCVRIAWSEAQPGDLVFYPSDSHIGIVGGWDDYGNIQIIHCASGSLNGVVITGISGFTSIGRPYYYS